MLWGGRLEKGCIENTGGKIIFIFVFKQRTGIQLVLYLMLKGLFHSTNCSNCLPFFPCFSIFLKLEIKHTMLLFCYKCLFSQENKLQYSYLLFSFDSFTPGKLITKVVFKSVSNI